jgi:hypothetical protein
MAIPARYSFVSSRSEEFRGERPIDDRDAEFRNRSSLVEADKKKREPPLRQHVHVPDRAALSDAAELIARFGEYAGSEAKLRADRSRDHGNVVHFTRWRLIERVIGMLTDEAVTDTVH